MGNSLVNDSLEGFVNRVAKKNYEKMDLKSSYDKYWLVRKYINKSANDAVKKGRNIYFDGWNEDEKKAFIKEEKRLKINKLSKTIIANVLLLGEVFVLVDTNVEPEHELDIENEEINEFLIFARDEISFDEPFYKLNIENKQIDIHKSRVLKISSDFVSTFKNAKNKKVVSDVEVALKDIINYEKISEDMNTLAREKKVDIYEIEGLNEQLMSNLGEEKIFKWVSLVNELKSVNNALMVDKKDGYNVKEINLSGASDLWKTSAINVCGALNRPLTVLFGESASGFSTGEEDNKAYYEAIEELQNYLREFYEFSDKFILKKIGKIDTELEFDFANIDGVNEKEQSEIFEKDTNSLRGLVEDGIITVKTAQLELRDKGHIKNLSDEDIEESLKLEQRLDYKDE